MLLREIRTIYRQELAGQYDAREADALFHRILEHYLGLPRFVLGLEPRKQLSREEEQPLFEALSALKANTPLQYITGVAHFRGLELRVGPGVLIPRPETEELVGWILERQGEDPAPARLLDIGTGSGCIAIALAREWPGAEVHALDISADALETARENARLNGVQVHFHRADIHHPPGGWPPFDLVVSNPPYIPREEAAGMHANVREHEPEVALFARDEDPLEYYRSICAFSREYLKPNGWLYLEIHEHFGPATRDLLVDRGFCEVLVKRDIFGKDRYVCGRNPEPLP